MSTTMEQQQTAVRKRKRLSMQMIVFMAVLGLPIAWLTYTVARLTFTSGIEQRGDYKWVDLKALGNFPFDDRIDTELAVPEDYRKLDGQKVLLVGQMYVDFTAEPLVDRFQLVYSIQNCCFNGPPKVQERVFAHIPEGSEKKVPVYGGLAEVYGTLHVKAVREKGRVVSLFDMDVERVRPAQ